MKDKDTRKSKGVAFILFLDKDSAQNCTRAINNKQVSHSFASVFLSPKAFLFIQTQICLKICKICQKAGDVQM